MKLFLAIAGVLAWLFGATLLLAPGQFYAPTGLALTPVLATLAQAHGATLIGLGTINWLARRAANAVVRGFETILQAKTGFRNERMATLSFDGMTVIVDTSSVGSPATLGFESDDSDRDFRTVIDRGAVSIESRQPTKNGASEQGTVKGPVRSSRKSRGRYSRISFATPTAALGDNGGLNDRVD